MDQVPSMPGFRFSPTDEELISYYLKRKVSGRLQRVDTITEIDLYKYEPWDLPGKSCLPNGDLQWFFFSRRGKKYPKGHKKERSTKAGYWKTTGKDRCICSDPRRNGTSRKVGMKKTLVFHIGRAPHGEWTNWVMYEYRLEDTELDMSAAIQDSYVVCRVFQKRGRGSKTAEEYGAPFREEDWNDETPPETGATISLEKGLISCELENSTLINANNNVTTCPGIAQELDNGVIILDKNYAPPANDEIDDFLTACVDCQDVPKLNVNRGESLQLGANKYQIKSDEIFEALEDIDCLSGRQKAIQSTIMQDNSSSFHLKGGMDVGVQGSASSDQFLLDMRESSTDSLQGCFLELNDLTTPAQSNFFLQETYGNWNTYFDPSNDSDIFEVPSMAWYQSENVNKNTGPNLFGSDQYISAEVAERSATAQHGNCMLLEGDNSEIELHTRPQADYSGTPFWTEGQ